MLHVADINSVSMNDGKENGSRKICIFPFFTVLVCPTAWNNIKFAGELWLTFLFMSGGA